MAVVGVPTEIKTDENRIAITPAGVHELSLAGHTVLVETGAGLGSAFTDDDYRAAGATIVPTAADAWGAHIVCKVKEPQQNELDFLRPDLVLFTYLHLAGQQAVQHSANAEAITHLTAALELLKTLPDTPERIQQELTLQVTLGTPLIATKGYFLEVEKVYRRALELCRSVGETPQLFSVLGGLWSFYGIRGDLQTSHELAEQRMRLAQSVRDPTFLLDAYRTLGMSLFWLGEFASARAHVEKSVALYDSQQHNSHSFLFLQEPKMHCLSFTAWSLWFLGYPDQALARMSDALALAQEYPDSYGQA